MTTSTFVLLPRFGLKAQPGSGAFIALSSLPAASSVRPPVTAPLPSAPHHSIQVVDAVSVEGPKLVLMENAAAAEANGPSSPLRALPVVQYGVPIRSALTATADSNATKSFTVECFEADTSRPLINARVDAYADNEGKVATAGFTDTLGRVTLSLPGDLVVRLFVDPGPQHWGAYRTSIPITTNAVIRVDDIKPVRPTDTDYLRAHYANTKFKSSTGVTVGVVDTGVGPHRDINLIGGNNTVTGEPRDVFSDWMGHGTHVAGIIGARGKSPHGTRGMAPDARILSYRVFDPAKGTASNYAILKSMIFAGEQKCDIINLSLALRGTPDAVVREAVRDARDQGMLVVVAAGNNGRKTVSFPAAYAGATAVSAMGDDRTFPAHSLPAADIVRPPESKSAPNEFVAAFSNVGPQIMMVGPGVGIISTLPNDAYGMFSGTSMAAPVVAGAAACLLSRHSSIFEMDRDRARSDALERLLALHCTKRGFGQEFEGFGLPDPNQI